MVLPNPHLFSSLPSFSSLKKLAQDPIDLTQEGVLNENRLEEYSLQAAKWHLLYATERVNSAVIQALIDLARESHAVAAMREMQRGEWTHDNLPVTHTALRLASQTSDLAAPAQRAVKMQRETHKRLETLLPKLCQEEGRDTLVVIGIGGSDLGTRAIYNALRPLALPQRRIFFVSNIDPQEVLAITDKVTAKKTLFLSISKSGSTQETLNNEQFLRDWLCKQGFEPRDQWMAITDLGSPMDDAHRYREVFHLPSGVGGRYSVTSVVGSLPLIFAFGSKIHREFLEGAHQMDCIALKENPLENLPLFAALLGIWNHNFLRIPTEAIIPYHSFLHSFITHLQQCSMESNGKAALRTGESISWHTAPILWGEVGTNAQHSFFQWIHQSGECAALSFIGFQRNRLGDSQNQAVLNLQRQLLSNLFAQALSLAKGKPSSSAIDHFTGNRPSHILFGEEFAPHQLGSLLAYHEHKIAFQGFIWGINSFDQPGVQLGKEMAQNFAQMLSESQEKRPVSSSLPLAFYRRFFP